MSEPGSSPIAEAQTTADNQQKSGWRFYSLGLVAANKKMSSLSIEVTPIEFFSLLNGELTDNKQELKAESEDIMGQKWSEAIDSTPSIMATWIPFGQTHRLTAPDVRRGDLVMIYQFGDTDEYWWEELNINKKRIVRRLETIIWAISNNSKENIEDDAKTTYWVEWSTHKKLLHIHTSKNDEEPFEYDIQLDCKNGRFVLKDDDDNYIEFDSKERFIKVHNKDKSFVQLDKKIITIESLDKVIINTKHFQVNAKETITFKTKDYTMTTKSYTLNSSKSYVATTPTFVLNGDLALNGNQTTTGTSDNHHSH